jgi:hypothetical protein
MSGERILEWIDWKLPGSEAQNHPKIRCATNYIVRKYWETEFEISF